MRFSLQSFSTAPAFTVWHSHPGQTSQVLITAGVDGDEYAGIEAAKRLIIEFTHNPPEVPITIIPIVNLAGYEKGVSYNPLDGRFPKYIYPGSPFGTSSSRLRYKMSVYTQGIKLWLDLHGGATDEHLLPFIWADKTGITKVDSFTLHLLSLLPTRTLLTESCLPPSRHLGKYGASYLIFESGELGKKDSHMVCQHLDWVKICLSNLKTPNIRKKFSPTYAKVHYHFNPPSPDTPSNLLWSSPSLYVTAT